MLKTLKCDALQSSEVNDIMAALFENSVVEKDHSMIVSVLCEKIGKELNHDEIEIRKLKEVGYHHDMNKSDGTQIMI